MYKGNEMHTVFEKDNCMLFGNAMTFMRRPLALNPLTIDADVVVLGLWCLFFFFELLLLELLLLHDIALASFHKSSVPCLSI